MGRMTEVVDHSLDMWRAGGRIAVLIEPLSSQGGIRSRVEL